MSKIEKLQDYGLSAIQTEQDQWMNYNFPETTSIQQLLGVVEEVGELSHFVLKRMQGIREGVDNYNNINSIEDHIKDAIGDITIYLMGFCNQRNYDYFEIIKETWDKVKQRDWIKFPKNGKTE